jgi:Restriction endonuclease EcoRV
MPLDLKRWLRDRCAEYTFDVTAVFHRLGTHGWPLEIRAADPIELERALAGSGHLLPLPKEPAALANILEVSIVDFLLKVAHDTEGLVGTRGTERGYPDIEFTGVSLNNDHWAVDVKVARRNRTKGQLRTESRITLYTGNTFFRFPSVHWPGNLRAFDDYAGHLDVIVIYTLAADAAHRVDDLRIIIQEPWRIASKSRSSTTREYLGAVDRISDLAEGKGEFATADAFYKYWRSYDFKLSKQVQRILDRINRLQREEIRRQGAQLEEFRQLRPGQGERR